MCIFRHRWCNLPRCSSLLLGDQQILVLYYSRSVHFLAHWSMLVLVPTWVSRLSSIVREDESGGKCLQKNGLDESNWAKYIRCRSSTRKVLEALKQWRYWHHHAIARDATYDAFLKTEANLGQHGCNGADLAYIWRQLLSHPFPRQYILARLHLRCSIIHIWAYSLSYIRHCLREAWRKEDFCRKLHIEFYWWNTNLVLRPPQSRLVDLRASRHTSQIWHRLHLVDCVRVAPWHISAIIRGFSARLLQFSGSPILIVKLAYLDDGRTWADHHFYMLLRTRCRTQSVDSHTMSIGNTFIQI